MEKGIKFILDFNKWKNKRKFKGKKYTNKSSVEQQKKNKTKEKCRRPWPFHQYIRNSMSAKFDEYLAIFRNILYESYFLSVL